MSRRRGRRAPPCPCGGEASYDDCCGRLHRGEVSAGTAEQLMRSRYSAFAIGDADYLLATWHPSSRPPSLQLDTDERWLGLEVLATTGGGLLEREGTVLFRARAGGGEIEERSRFTRVDGRWVYLGPA